LKITHAKLNLSYGKSKISYAKLKITHAKLNLSYDKSKISYGKLKISYDKLKITYGKSKISYDKLKIAYDKLNSFQWNNGIVFFIDQSCIYDLYLYDYPLFHRIKK